MYLELYILFCRGNNYILGCLTMSGPLRLITFDFVGTLIRFRDPPVAKYVEFAAAAGIQVEYTSLQNRFYTRWRLQEEQHPHFGATTNKSSLVWWTSLVKGIFRDELGSAYQEDQMQKVASDLYSYYHSPKPYLLLDDGKEGLGKLAALKKMRQGDLKIGLVSNFDNRLHDIVPALGLRGFVDFIVTSEDAKSSKPQEKIFDYAARKSELDDLHPSQILHVGDDMDKDYIGARQVCWNALLVDRWEAGYSLVEEEDVITNLTQIFDKYVTLSV